MVIRIHHASKESVEDCDALKSALPSFAGFLEKIFGEDDLILYHMFSISITPL